MKKGIDVSYWQGAIDWHKVASRGIEWAAIRCSYGTAQDSTFTTNWQNAQAAGIKRAAYLYFKADQSPQGQASKLAQLSAGAELTPVLDCERNTSDVMTNYQTRLLECIAGFVKITGVFPVIYTSPSFALTYLKAPEFSLCPLWIAHWNAAAPNIPAPWFGGDYWAWQFRVTTFGLWYGSQSKTLDLDVMP